MADESLKWFQFAEMDFQTAMHLYKNMYPPPREIICFHCQQAVEKLLKGLLVHFGQEIVKTHDLTLLVSLLQNFIDLSDEEKKICAKLSLYAVETRYPHELLIEDYHVKAAVEDTEIIFMRIKNFGKYYICIYIYVKKNFSRIVIIRKKNSPEVK